MCKYIELIRILIYYLILNIIFNILFNYFLNKVSLSSPSWSGIFYVKQNFLKFEGILLHLKFWLSVTNILLSFSI